MYLTERPGEKCYDRGRCSRYFIEDDLDYYQMLGTIAARIAHCRLSDQYFSDSYVDSGTDADVCSEITGYFYRASFDGKLDHEQLR